MYAAVCQQMIQDAEKTDNYIIVRFEDLVSEAIPTLEKIYTFLDLDINDVAKFRLQAKRSMNQDGTRSYSFGQGDDREIQWFNLEAIPNSFRQNVNANQIARLSEEDKKNILSHAQGAMNHFGYLSS